MSLGWPYRTCTKAKPKKKEQKEDENPVYNIPRWTKKNAHLFVPPICNKLMYRSQLNVMFVGGPNTRKDFHIDCGEELFYQIKGNIKLPTYQQGKRKIVEIKEGQIYLLRARVPHSPQRPEEESLGLVIERKRVKHKKEYDALRYYVCDFDEDEKDKNKILWEKWFYCSNLGTQLPPVVQVSALCVISFDKLSHWVIFRNLNHQKNIRVIVPAIMYQRSHLSYRTQKYRLLIPLICIHSLKRTKRTCQSTNDWTFIVAHRHNAV